MNKHIHATSAQSAERVTVTTTRPIAAHVEHKNHVAGTCINSISSIFVLQSEPIGGLWFGNGTKEPLDLHQRWQMRGGTICWEPSIPANALYWSERIEAQAQEANQRRQAGAFLRLSRTSQTRATWSLPAIAACPLRDETCQHCYALERWYRNDLPRQIDRVLRLEYLRRLIHQDSLATWVDWMVTKLKALPADEPWPPALRRQGLPDGFYCGDRVQYFRWHDSGDLFHEEYALAIFSVCEATPRVAHWLPTRMGGLVRTLVQQGAVIPNNLSIQVSVQRGGKLEQAQIQALREVLEVQPSARIGLSYSHNGPAGRNVDVRLVKDTFGDGATVCPALTASAPKDRVCKGCRRCWGASIGEPVVYPMS
ncbi:MAG: hypothetical protein ACLQU3_28020 [Limisphaerales bacterium]